MTTHCVASRRVRYGLLGVLLLLALAAVASLRTGLAQTPEDPADKLRKEAKSWVDQKGLEEALMDLCVWNRQLAQENARLKKRIASLRSGLDNLQQELESLDNDTVKFNSKIGLLTQPKQRFEVPVSYLGGSKGYYPHLGLHPDGKTDIAAKEQFKVVRPNWKPE